MTDTRTFTSPAVALVAAITGLFTGILLVTIVDTAIESDRCDHLATATGLNLTYTYARGCRLDRTVP